MYTIRYSTRRGGSGMTTANNIDECHIKLLDLFIKKQTARAEKNNIVIGEVYKQDNGRWAWYLDMAA